MRRCLTTALVALALSAPLTALAQDNPNCPPGAWFCEEAEVPAPPEAAPAEPPPAAPPRPRPPRASPPQRGATVVIPPPPPGRSAPPPVVIYQPVPNAPPPQVVIIAPGYYPAVQGPVRPVPPPAKKRLRPWRAEFGLNLRLEGVAMGREVESTREDAGSMGGMGMSLRFRPVPAFAIDAGIDVIGGLDYNGFNRRELPLSLSGILYVNPRSRVQFYLTGGADWSHAEVESDEYSPLLPNGYSAEYSYFGGHGGIGLEFRLSRHIALDIDGLAFVRGRTDDGPLPEFMDEHGRTTNTSGGGLFRAGITFWW